MSLLTGRVHRTVHRIRPAGLCDRSAPSAPRCGRDGHSAHGAGLPPR